VTRAARRLRGELIFGELDAGAPRSIPALGRRGEASLSTATGIDAHLTIMAARSFPTAVSRTPVGKEHAAAPAEEHVLGPAHLRIVPVTHRTIP
jgi:hypothetical protein